jgi:thymidine phosphorylase
VVELGGGRRRPSDAVDPAVGLTEIAGIGAEVGPDAPLARVHARDEAAAAGAAARLAAAYEIGDAAPPPAPAVLARIAP